MGGASLETFSGEGQLKKPPCIRSTRIMQVRRELAEQKEKVQHLKAELSRAKSKVAEAVVEVSKAKMREVEVLGPGGA